MMDIVGKRYWFFGLSLLVIVPGMIALLVWGLAPGHRLHRRQPARGAASTPATRPAPAEVVALYDELGVGDPAGAERRHDGHRRSQPGDRRRAEGPSSWQRCRPASAAPSPSSASSWWAPAVGAEVAQRAAGAVGLAALGILLYITYAFRGVPHAFRFGVAAIMAMLHDVAVVFGVEAILGHFLGWEVDSLFLTALLTVIGFSVHDTIVVFDRIRENQTPPPAPQLRDAGQPLHRPDAGPLHQHTAHGHADAAGLAAIRWRDHPALRHRSCWSASSAEPTPRSSMPRRSWSSGRTGNGGPGSEGDQPRQAPETSARIHHTAQGRTIVRPCAYLEGVPGARSLEPGLQSPATS